MPSVLQRPASGAGAGPTRVTETKGFHTTGLNRPPGPSAPPAARGLLSALATQRCGRRRQAAAGHFPPVLGDRTGHGGLRASPRAL